jgi:uncharacterized membrane protein YciS (DUF1049 family)
LRAEIEQPIVRGIEMEVALTTQDAIHFLTTTEPKVIVALLGLGILILVAGVSRQFVSFLGSCLLAVIAFSIFEFPDSLSTILIVGFAVGSVLISIAGLRQRRQLTNLRRELTRLSLSQTRLETAESRRVLEEMRSTHSARSRPAAVDSEAGQSARGTVDSDAHASTVVDLKQAR